MLDDDRDRIFGEWLASHKGILFKVIHADAFEHADRQDRFQEIVLQVWRSVDAFRGESSVPTWMYRVALNTAIAWTRKEDRHQRGKQPLEVVEGLLTTASAAPDPRVAWLYRQIAQLDDQATRELRLTLVGSVAAAICGTAIDVASRRINDVAYSDDWPVLLGLIFLCTFSLGHRGRRRSVQRDILPRKRRLEALLKELDAPKTAPSSSVTHGSTAPALTAAPTERSPDVIDGLGFRTCSTM